MERKDEIREITCTETGYRYCLHRKSEVGSRGKYETRLGGLGGSETGINKTNTPLKN